MSLRLFERTSLSSFMTTLAYCDIGHSYSSIDSNGISRTMD